MKHFLILIAIFSLASCQTILKIEEWRAKTDFYSILILTIIGGIGFLISEFRNKKNDDK